MLIRVTSFSLFGEGELMTTNKKWLLIIGVTVLIFTFAIYVFYRPVTPFAMEVIPTFIDDAVPGRQSCVFLVVVTDEGQASSNGKAVNI